MVRDLSNTPPEERSTEETAGREALADALQVSFRLLRWIMILMVGLYLVSGVFVVKQHENALVLVFGKVQGIGEKRIKGPGLHWTWPKPFARPVKVDTELVKTVRSDAFWFAMEPGQSLNNLPEPPSTLNPAEDGYTLTADANLLHTVWAVRYTVEDPEAYAFGFLDAEALIRDILDHAVVKTSARFPVDRALRTGIDAFRSTVEQEIRAGCAGLAMGVDIQGVEIEGLYPPRQVLDAFALVTSTEQIQDQMISSARQYAVSTMNEVKGDAERILSEGRAARQEYVSSVEASANYLQEVRDEYRSQPYVVSLTLLQESLVRTLPNLEGQHVIPQPSGDGRHEVRLLLSPPLDNPLAWGEED